MDFHATVAQRLPVGKVMLTVFLRNKSALEFYQRLGFARDAVSPEPRQLRKRKAEEPDYMIMSRVVSAV
jgi:ribosomal protein S18 acetylase RimI-like enzyme